METNFEDNSAWNLKFIFSVSKVELTLARCRKVMKLAIQILLSRKQKFEENI